MPLDSSSVSYAFSLIGDYYWAGSLNLSFLLAFFSVLQAFQIPHTSSGNS